MTRAEQLAAKKVELAELTKIAKVVLIDGFSDCHDGEAENCYMFNDTGHWNYQTSAGVSRYNRAYITFSPSNSRDIYNHVRVSYEYDVLDPNGVKLNNPPAPNSNSPSWYATYNEKSSTTLRRRHILLIEKSLKKHNGSFRRLLGSTSMVLKLSRRPTDDEYAWAASVIQNEDIKTDAGTHIVQLSYQATVVERFQCSHTNGLELAISEAKQRMSNNPNTQVNVRILTRSEPVVHETSFQQEIVSLNGVYAPEKERAIEI